MTDNRDQLEAALREWLLVYAENDGECWSFEIDEIPDLAAHLKAAGLVSRDDIEMEIESDLVGRLVELVPILKTVEGDDSAYDGAVWIASAIREAGLVSVEGLADKMADRLRDDGLHEGWVLTVRDHIRALTTPSDGGNSDG